MNQEITTKSNEPFAVLKVPDDILADLVDKPQLIEELKKLIGVKVLIIGERVNLFMGKMAREEVERLHQDIHNFLAESQ